MYCNYTLNLDEQIEECNYVKKKESVIDIHFFWNILYIYINNMNVKLMFNGIYNFFNE